MGMQSSKEPKEARLRAFHAELALYLFDKGRMGEVLTTSAWNMLMGQGLGALSPKVAADYTFAMEVLGLIRRSSPINTGRQGRPGKGIVVLAVVTPEPVQWPPGIAATAVPALV